MCLSTAVLVCGLYFPVRGHQQDSFDALELESMQKNCQRVRQALQQELTALDSKCGDWSLWDDTCEFLAGRAPGYAQDNLIPASVVSLGTNFILYFDASPRLVHSIFVDMQTIEPCQPPPGLLEQLQPGSALFAHAGPESRVGGILQAEPTSILVAARPIMRTDRSGQVLGTLIMGRLLDTAMLQQVATVSQLPVEFLPPSPGMTDWSAQTLDEDNIEGRVALTGIDGRQALSGRIVLPRSIHQKGTESTRMLLLVSLLVGCLGIMLSVLLLRFLVIRPLALMRSEVLSIASSGELERKLTVRGKDEITDFARTFNDMTAKLAQSYEQLKVAEARNQFLANVSHEIRTPLTSILGYTDTLLGGASTEAERTDQLQIIRRSGLLLQNLLDNLLDSAKAERGQMVVQPATCDVAELVRDVMDLMRSSATEKGLALETRVCGAIPARITTDPARLRQTLLNLVGNAIKFTARGRVGINLGLAGDKLRFEVVDTGAGLTPEQIARLFRPFTQADASMTRRVGGTGLGLALSRQLAVLLGGDLSCSSEPGQGSTFVCVVATGPLDGVPLVDSIQRRPEPTAEAAPGGMAPSDPTAVAIAPTPADRQPHLRGLSVLVAEDMPDSQKLLSAILRRAGAEVEVATDGRQAYERIVTRLTTGRPFDLVLMDMQMPEMNGWDATVAARKAGYQRPIIALTAHAMASDRQRCLESGCDDYRTKPIGNRALVETLADWASRSGSDQRAATGVGVGQEEKRK